MSKTRFLGHVEVPVATQPKEAVSLQQVENMLSKYHKKPVTYATTTALADVTTLPQAKIDGNTVAVGDSILVKDQANAIENGIYTVTAVAPNTPGTTEVPASATASYTGGAVTDADVTVTDATLIAKVEETETADTTIVLTYDGTTDNAWKLADGTQVTLADYGIVIDETTNAVADGDTITITYTALVPAVPATVGDATLERRDDWATDQIILIGTCVTVLAGQAYGDTKWCLTAYDTDPKKPVKVDTDTATFVKDIQMSSAKIKVQKGTITGDGVTKTFSLAHNFNLVDVDAYTLTIKDNQKNDVFVDNAPTVGNEGNSVTVEFDVPPEATETFKVYAVGLE